jgi:hypothetical protein
MMTTLVFLSLNLIRRGDECEAAAEDARMRAEGAVENI